MKSYLARGHNMQGASGRDPLPPPNTGTPLTPLPPKTQQPTPTTTTPITWVRAHVGSVNLKGARASNESQNLANHTEEVVQEFLAEQKNFPRVVTVSSGLLPSTTQFKARLTEENISKFEDVLSGKNTNPDDMRETYGCVTCIGSHRIFNENVYAPPGVQPEGPKDDDMALEAKERASSKPSDNKPLEAEGAVTSKSSDETKSEKKGPLQKFLGNLRTSWFFPNSEEVSEKKDKSSKNQSSLYDRLKDTGRPGDIDSPIGVKKIAEGLYGTYFKPSEKEIRKLLKNKVQEKKNDPDAKLENLDKKEWVDIVSDIDIELQNQRNYKVYPGTKKVDLTVDRGDGKDHKIACRYYESDTAKVHDNKPTMVLFHGNACTADDMNETANFYKEQGWNVLAVTMGGYPGSDEKVETDEKTAIQDVARVLEYLEQQGVETIGVHGHSLGGSLAMHATQLSDKVAIVVADKTFDSGRSVAPNLTRNKASKIPGLQLLHPAWAIRQLTKRVLPAGQEVPGVYIKGPDGKPVIGEDGKPLKYRTNGLDSKENVKKFGGDLVVIGGDNDDLMGKKYDRKNKNYAGNLSEDLKDAHKNNGIPNKGGSYEIRTDQEHGEIGLPPGKKRDELIKILEQVRNKPKKKT